MNKMVLEELLAPAGSYDVLVIAVNAGADAVYIAGGYLYPDLLSTLGSPSLARLGDNKSHFPYRASGEYQSVAF